ncbi:MAG: endonuclease V [Actinomycetota bacterium]
MTARANAWPQTREELRDVQDALAVSDPPPWHPGATRAVGGVWFTSPTGSPGETPGEPAWAAAVVEGAEAVVRGETGAGYVAGALALREGPLLEAAVRALPRPPDILLVNATGRDHPRGAGLALHLGAVLGLPTVGVTVRPLLAAGPEPVPERWATSPLVLDGVIVAAWLRTQTGVRPVVVHPAWRTDLDTALAVARTSVERARTPEPMRLARRAARLARARDEGRLMTV